MRYKQFSQILRNQGYTDRIKRLAKRLELDVTRKIEDLSLGNRKKVGIVQTLAHKPKLLILDEPTSGLDPLMQHTFFDLLKEERDQGATIFFSSHILAEIQKTCDRVAIIKAGRLVKVEAVASLTHNNIKHVSITLDGNYDIDLQLKGMTKQVRTGKTTNFLYSGEIQPLLVKLSHLQRFPLRFPLG